MLRQERNVGEVVRKISVDPTQLADQPAKLNQLWLKKWLKRKQGNLE